MYLDAKARLFTLQRPQQQDAAKGKPNSKQAYLTVTSEADKLEIAKLLGKLDRIESDILFDKKLAEMQWRSKRIILEREFSEASKKAAENVRAKATAEKAESDDSDSDTDSENDVNAQAERIAADILAQSDSDDDGLADLFASLPVSEIDPTTGKMNTVVNNRDGSKLIIRDFGKWTGVSPVRALEEACRSR